MTRCSAGPHQVEAGPGGRRVLLHAAALVCLSMLLSSWVWAAHPGNELTWEMPGKLAIYDLEFGPALKQDEQWQFLGNIRTFDVEQFGERLTLMVRFGFSASRSETPLRFVIKLHQTRPFEETVHLRSRRGDYSYMFTIHNPEDFIGSGSVYLYYGFSIVQVFEFTIVQGL